MPRKRRRAAHGSRPPKVTPIRTGWRVQVFDPLANDGRGAYISAWKALKRPARTLTSEAEAWALADEAEDLLDVRGASEITVEQIRIQWLARKYDDQGRKIKDSTHITNADRTKTIVARFGPDHPLAVGDHLLAHARQLGPAARGGVKAMFNWATEEGLIPESPVAKLKVRRGSAVEEARPATQAQMGHLLPIAREMYRDVADWIEFGSLVGTRPGETDTLRFSDFNADLTRVQILRAYNVKTRRIETPKRAHPHWINVPPRARQIVRAQRIRHRGDYVFVNTQGGHWTTTSRQYHWNAIMEAAGFRRRVGAEWEMDFSTYEATRHVCGWHLVNVMLISSEEVAHQLRHDDHGELVRKLYGRRDRTMAIDAIAAAWENQDRQDRKEKAA